jgi:hypothetical protein
MTSTLKSTGTKMAAKGSNRTPRSCARISSMWHAWRETAERLQQEGWVWGWARARPLAVVGLALATGLNAATTGARLRVFRRGPARAAPVVELHRQRVTQPLEQLVEVVEVVRAAQHQALQLLQRVDALLPVH